MKNISDYFGTKTAIKCENEQQFRKICNLLGIGDIHKFDKKYNCILIAKGHLGICSEFYSGYTILPYSDFVSDVPELVGMKMEVSQFADYWCIKKVLGKYNDAYITTDGGMWKHARPITKKVLTATLTELAEMLNYDEIQIK